MENASKALIMAGSVLIALMIIGALILMFSNLTSYQDTNTKSTRSAQISEFNNQYETYNRKDVRGSDLYSLLNKVIDYNRRQSTEGTGWSDTGEEIAFQPITINFTIKNSDFGQLSADGTKRLIRRSSYTISSTSNDFENRIKGTIDNLEDEYDSDSLSKLTTGLSKIFLDGSPSKEEKIEAIETFNSLSKKKSITLRSNNDADINSAWNELNGYKEDVYTYYEYIQFKRLHFDCTEANYNNQTGRIVEMTFTSNGKFN